MIRFLPAIAAATLLAGCGSGSERVDTNAAVTTNAVDTDVVPVDEGAAAGETAAVATNGWLGRWTGPEGLFLTVEAGAASGTYDLVVKGDLDSEGDRFTGTAEGNTIVFTRNGTRETIRKASGDETGLKYLAGKADCVMIKPGEGFCRD
ncbi:hypothetical protein [Allosphingosinicella indica]|uniref:Lipoprotein n=1 Tax=Allosphingosinicella indica TaxID=941907 RepID=A0A1X7FYV6_9SPHN|nr:hypothetical protein [Allosphingosinicella indica]SMF61272.1 hypothetical protein SAMN06295910_0256 [Allosphingosinicella indica]